MEDNRNRKNGKKGVLWVVMIGAACGLAAALFVLIKSGADSRQQAADAEALREQVVAEATAAPQPTPEPTAEPEQPAGPKEWWEDYAVQPDKDIDFAALSAINEDVRAWITIPGTEIDYPVLYDVKYSGHYLSYDIEHNRDKSGEIFFDDFNSDDFSDRVTVMYGHNMKNGSMFAQLHLFEDAAFFDANPVIKLYTPDYAFEYEIIAANEASDDHIMALNDFTDDQVYEEYLESIYDVRDMNANFRQVELTTDDRLLILATCVEGDDYARYLVHGRLKAIE